MESFQAALQIPMPLTENAWDLLLPRLLAQRPDAEKQAIAAVNKGRTPVAAPERRGPHNVDSREAQDREWEESQAPLRDRLGRYADMIMGQAWQNGSSVTNANCPSFAADVLLGSRQMYLSEPSQEDVSAGPCGRLVLDNMKWIFDVKIKPLTEKFRREIFLCHDCTTNKKFYGFEAVIQHYGAKHTNSFSVGNVVVHWREAEWPEHPPFHPNPGRLPHTGRSNHQQQNRGLWNRYPPLQHNMGFASAGPHEISSSPRPFAASQVSPGLNHAASASYNSGWMSPVSFPSRANMATQAGLAGPAGFQMNYPHPSNVPLPQSHSMPQMVDRVPMQHSGGQSLEPAMGPETENWLPEARALSHQTRFGSHQNFPPRFEGLGKESLYPEDPHDPTIYSRFREVEKITQKEVNALSEVATNIWSSTAGVKELPTSLRVYMVIFYMEEASESQLGHSLDLDLFNHIISCSTNTAVIKNAPGLACKKCALRRDDQHMAYQSYYSRIDRRHLYTLSSLIKHFLRTHVSELMASSAHWDSGAAWQRHMIELPESDLINDLENAPGMDLDKKRLFAHVFPSTRGFGWVPRITRAPGCDQDQYYAMPSRYDHAELRSHSAAEDSQAGVYAPANSRLFETLPKAPSDEVTLSSSRARLEAESSDRRPLAPEVSRHRTSDLQYQEHLQQDPPRTRSVIYEENGRGQRSHRVLREFAPESYRMLPPDGWVYVQEPGLSFHSTHANGDIGLPHKANGDRDHAGTMREEEPHLVRYVSRSKDWSPTDEEHNLGPLVPNNGSNGRSSGKADVSRRYNTHGQPFEESLSLPPPANRLVGDPQQVPRTSDVSDPVRSTQFTPTAEAGGWFYSSTASRTSGTSMPADLRSVHRIEGLSRQTSGLPTPTRINEQLPYAMVRSSSRRFDRYEAARRHLDRPASQSPLPRPSVPLQDHPGREPSPALPEEETGLVHEDRPHFIGERVSYGHPSPLEESRERVIYVPAEAINEHNSPRLIRGPSDSLYEAQLEASYYDGRIAQGGEYIRYHEESPRETMYEPQRMIYVPEHETLLTEREERRHEEARASVPPGAPL